MKELGKISESKSAGIRDQSKDKGKSSREASEYSNNAGTSWLKILGVGALLTTEAMISGGADAAVGLSKRLNEGVVSHPYIDWQNNNAVGLGNAYPYERAFLNHAAPDTCANDMWPRLKAVVFQQEQCSIEEGAESSSIAQVGVEAKMAQSSNLASSRQELAEVIVKHPEMMKKALEAILNKPERAKDLLQTILKQPEMMKKALEMIVDNPKNLKKMWKRQNSEFEQSRALEIKDTLNDLGVLLGTMNGLFRKKNCFGQVSTEECIKETGKYPFIEKNCYETDHTKMEKCIRDNKIYPSSTARDLETKAVQPSSIMTPRNEIQEAQAKEVQLSDSISLYQEFTKALLNHPDRIKEALGIILKSPEMTKEAVEIILDNPKNVRNMHTIQSSDFEKLRAIEIKRAIIELKSQLEMMTSEFVDKNCYEKYYTEECKKPIKRYIK